MVEKKEYLKSYYQRNRDKILQKQKELYQKNKEHQKQAYKKTQYICRCGKLVSSLRTHTHEGTKYHTSRMDKLSEELKALNITE